MCGIIGSISSKSVDGEWVRKGLKQIVHRGPDAEGFWCSEDQTAVLGHRRLSIIDLSDLGKQPMHFEDASLSIVFNGEIYNYIDVRDELKSRGHSFKSQSDTEVLLHAYVEFGIDFVNKLNGMFAFCLLDKKNNRALLVRDRVGEKPLFYSFTDGVLNFASEIKALMENPKFDKTVDYKSLDCLLTYGFIPSDKSIFLHTRKLQPGHMIIFDLGASEVTQKQYWILPEFDTTPSNQKPIEELKYDLNLLLKDSIRRQLVADVPVGVLLSGGVDSSIVTAYASQVTKSVKTFTVSFPQNKKFDESNHARLIAKHFHTDHIEIEGITASPDLLNKLAYQYDEPMIDSSMIPTYIVTNLIKKYCTVALGGDGGDELFGGYGHYSRLLWMAEKVKYFPTPFKTATSLFAKFFLPIGFKGRIWLQSLGDDLDKGLPLIATLFESQFRKSLMTKDIKWELLAESMRQSQIPLDPSLLQRATRMDFYNYLPNDILVKVDRASMLNSLELRAPFLDYRVIEYAFKHVPDEFKASPRMRKGILKGIAKDLLPSEFDFERKQGFSVPLGSWIKTGQWKEFFEDTLFSNNDNFFDLKTIETIYKSHLKGNENTERLFALVMLKLWKQAYGISF